MWLITPIGFFSIVQKPSDVADGTLTVRARVRADLEALRTQYLPDLGPVSESQANDYRFRAVAPRAQVASTMAAMVNDLDYSNFKNQVAKVQGQARAHLYHDVWDVLYRLQSQPAKYTGKLATGRTPPVWHPRPDDGGKRVRIQQPSQPSPLAAWDQPDALACVVPDGPMPPEVNGIPSLPWRDRPQTPQAWEALADAHRVEEPAFQIPAGSAKLQRAAGVVVREPDGRVWVVAPSNAFGGYTATFPKGRIEAGMSAQAAALMEAYEESGLRVKLLRHLVDARRSQTYTRYYLAERLGGTPADMGWESQAVMLVPPALLSGLGD